MTPKQKQLMENRYFTKTKMKNIRICSGKVYIEDERWITINADEENGHKGQHVLIKENGDIIFGLGGKFKHLSELGGKQRKEFLFTSDEAKEYIRREFKQSQIKPLISLVNTDTEYNPVKHHEKQPSDYEIIKELGGPDKTKGSCASLALAYTAQKGGLNVLDFRGGFSREFFANESRLKSMFEDAIIAEEDGRTVKAAFSVLNHVMQAEIGKEFLLSTGWHMAVIKKGPLDQIYYLELQSDVNGWKKLGSPYSMDAENKLRSRFRAYKTGTKRAMSTKTHLFDCDKLRENKSFQLALGFINTDKSKQEKGIGGGIK